MSCHHSLLSFGVNHSVSIIHAILHYIEFFLVRFIPLPISGLCITHKFEFGNGVWHWRKIDMVVGEHRGWGNTYPLSYDAYACLRSHELTLYKALQQHTTCWNPSMHTLVRGWQDGSLEGTMDWWREHLSLEICCAWKVFWERGIWWLSEIPRWVIFLYNSRWEFD